jgi:Domain of unknown function (DUF4845)
MGKIKGLIGLLVVAGGFYIAWNLIPPYFHNYELQDDLDDIARRSSYTMKTDDEVKQMVMQKAQNNDVTLREEQITVSRSGDGIGIAVSYSVHVEMMVHPVDLDFSVKSYNKRI